MLAPSLALVAVFVYGLIGYTMRVSITDQHDAISGSRYVGLDNYIRLVADDQGGRFMHSLKLLAIFVIVFIAGTMIMGLLWAYLFDRGVRAEPLVRALYLFPIAISFIATGVVWRWLLNSSTGDNAQGLNYILESLHLGFLENRWFLEPNWGMAAIAIPAIWQMAGYVMAIFLAGFRGIPQELREAAIMDGTNTYQLYRHVLFPQLTPAALSAFIIVASLGVKVFDLIMSISGTGYVTEVPAVYIWNTLLVAGRAGGRLKPGRHINYDHGTRLSNLFVTTQQLIGVNETRFSDATEPLAGLV